MQNAGQYLSGGSRQAPVSVQTPRNDAAPEGNDAAAPGPERLDLASAAVQPAPGRRCAARPAMPADLSPRGPGYPSTEPWFYVWIFGLATATQCTKLLLLHILPGFALWVQRPSSYLLFTLAFTMEASIFFWFFGPARKLSEIRKMQDAWWFWIRGSLQGPVSLKMLELTLHHGVTTQQTLVWKEGLSHWMSMAELSSLRKAGALQVEPESPLDLARAGAWRRFLARMLDIWIISVPLALLGWLLLVQIPGFAPWFQRPSSPFLLTLCLLPLALLVEAGIFARAGNTPGKALLGVVVMTLDGQRLTGLQYLRRQLGVFWYGFAMGLPVISLIAMAAHGLGLQHGEPTAYDANRYTVRARRPSQTPVWVHACIGCSIAALILAQVYLGY